MRNHWFNWISSVLIILARILFHPDSSWGGGSCVNYCEDNGTTYGVGERSGKTLSQSTKTKQLYYCDTLFNAVCVCVCVCGVYTCTCLCMFTCMWSMCMSVENRLTLDPILYSYLHSFLTWGSIFELGAHTFRLADWQMSLWIHQFLLPQHWGYTTSCFLCFVF